MIILFFSLFYLMQTNNISQSLIPQQYFFFINTKSGKRQGKNLIDLNAKVVSEAVRHICQIRVVFVDLFDHERRQNAIAELRDKNIQKDMTRVIICGGDGTINWVMNQFTKNGVDLRNIVFGVLPIGTGNDFCRSIGWSPDKIYFTLRGLIMQFEQWNEAVVKKYDLWDVQVKTYNNGRIYDVKNKKQIAKSEKQFRKVWTNYVGIGLDARVTYTVQKNRTQWPTINKICYALVGCFNIFRPISSLKKKISSFSQNGESGSLLSSQPFQIQMQKTDNSDATSARDSIQLQIKSGFKGMVCLNSTSYMAGLRDVWKTTSVAVQGYGKQRNNKFRAQACQDGMVQFVAYKNQIGLALERIVRGGSRVTQGSGPFVVTMRQPIEQQQITHMQIDGESIKIVNLQSYTISRSQLVKGHQINVLAKRESQL